MAQVTDWIAQSYTANSAPLNASRVINMFAETEVQDAKNIAPVGIWMHPGTSPFANTGSGPIIAFTVMRGLVYALTGDSLFQINHNGTSIYLGHTSVSTNGCSIENNGTTICWVDGVTGWTYNTTTGVHQIVDKNFFPSTTVTYYDTYFVFARRGTQQFFISPPQWNGIDPLNGAMFASKEATSDLIVGIANSHQQLFIFGEKRGEVWYDAGNPAPQFPFQRSFGAMVQRGLMAPYTLVLEDNTLFFLGDDLIFYRLEGFVPQRMSNHAIETQWQKYRGLYYTKAFSYTVLGHKMIALTFPEAHATWVLDLATKRWHERESWTADNHDSSIGRWRVNCVLNNSSSITQYPDLLMGDSLSGRIDQLNNNTFTEFGATMRALVIGPPLHSDRRRVFLRKFELDVESGVGAPYTAQLLNEFCPDGITMTTPTEIQTPGPLLGLPATYSNFVFSNWVYLPNDSNVRGLMFGDGNLTITIANNNSSGANQIIVQAKDAGGAAILDAEYQWSAWSNWVWVGISCDTATHQLQCWVSTLGYGDVQLTAVVLTWSSTNPIGNDGSNWTLIPQAGP
jgi:hypothetical protein